MVTKKTPDENLLDAQLDFIINSPQEQFDEFLAESGINVDEINRKAMLAFDRALESHAKARQAIDALASLNPTQQKAITHNLKIRRSILTAFREHRVIVASIPKRFLGQLADQLGQTVEVITTALSAPAPRLTGQYKSDEKPNLAPPRVTFAQLLSDAAMSEEEVQELMREGD